MNRSSILATICALAGATSAMAQDHASVLLGSPAAAASAERSMVIGADARWVNVSQGEIVRFVAGNTEFTWKFDGVGARSVDLRQIAPAGTLSRTVTAYVAAGPGRRP